MTATAALTGHAAAPALATSGPSGIVAGGGEADPGEQVLSAAELLSLLEQGEAFGQALARAATSPMAPPDAPRAAAASTGDADRDEDPGGAPCDIVTLLRLLEQPAAPAALAAAAAAASAMRDPLPPAATADGAAAFTDGPRGRAAAASGVSAGAVTALTGTPIGTPPGASGPSSDGDGANLLQAVLAPLASAAENAAHEAARDAGAAHSGAATAPAADPSQVTLQFAQSLRSSMSSATPVERSVHVPVRDPAWPQAVAAEIQFLADQQVEAATLRLSPEHLGPLEVRIDVRDGNVSVAFGVAHADTQSALEQALPRLREMLAAAGLQLGQASVQQEARRGSRQGSDAPGGDGAAAGTSREAAPATLRALGLVDDYA